MIKITPLIHADPERSASGEYLLPGTTYGFTPDQIRDGHKVVIPVYNAQGELDSLEIQQNASTDDICAVLHSCGVYIQGIAGEWQLDRLGRVVRYSLIPSPDVGEDIYSFVPTPNQDIIT